jgi:uncharacterized protein involved in exopolysaccharide biosynthesis
VKLVVDGDSVTNISEYYSIIRRWWMVITIAAAVGLVVGTLVLSFQRDEYQSEAQVEVRPLVSSGDDPNLDVSRQVNPDTEQAIAGSQRVVERALAILAVSGAMNPGDPLAIDFDDPEVELEAAVVVVDGTGARRVA